MADLVLLVPSRGRPEKIRRLIAACAATCTRSTRLAFGFDSDDPALAASILAVTGGHTFSTGPRMGLAGWSNRLLPLARAPYVGSIGDDMIPVTPGWDATLMEACGSSGMAYPNDKRRDDIPEIIVMTSDIPAALGWICLPTLHHWYVDNVWSDLGRGAGCITYLPDVVVEHRHPNVAGGDRPDLTYNEAAATYAADLAAYQRWRLTGMRADIGKVKACSAAAVLARRRGCSSPHGRPSRTGGAWTARVGAPDAGRGSCC